MTLRELIFHPASPLQVSLLKQSSLDSLTSPGLLASTGGIIIQPVLRQNLGAVSKPLSPGTRYLVHPLKVLTLLFPYFSRFLAKLPVI